MLTSIIIVTYNQLQYTKECIDSLRKYTERGSYEIIIVDNASTDGTIEWLKEQSDIQLIQNLSNIGFTRGCNQGIEKAKGENILLLNNDVVVTYNWLTNLLTCLYSQDNIGAVGPITNNASYYTAIPTQYKNIDEMNFFSKSYNKMDKSKWEQRLKLIGFCMLIKAEVLKKVGPLDERFSPGNYEDDDISLRIVQNGYKLYLCRDTFVHHYGSISWREDVAAFSKILGINGEKFKTKWGFCSTELNIHYDLINFTDQIFQKEMNILHIGAGCGATLLEMKRRYPTAYLWGIEENQAAALIANQVTTTYSIQYDTSHKYFTENMFHIIILSANIEKVRLSAVLESISLILKKNGNIIMASHN